jgi:hypothetical protein
MVHSDGDLSEILPDLIDAGVELLNPIQPECMDILWLKREYGSSICFNGGVSSQLTIPRGSPEQIRAEIQACLRYLGKGGGYVIGPTKTINADIPAENGLAVLDAILNQEHTGHPIDGGDALPERVEALWSVYSAFHQ